MRLLNWLREVQCWHADLIRDEGGRPSLAKQNLFIGALIASVVVVKSMYLGTLTLEMFSMYLLFMTGHHLLSKAVDKYNAKP